MRPAPVAVEAAVAEHGARDLDGVVERVGQRAKEEDCGGDAEKLRALTHPRQVKPEGGREDERRDFEVEREAEGGGRDPGATAARARLSRLQQID